MTIKIELRTDHPSWPDWKLAEASLLFHADDGFLAGLTLRGFTIGTSRYEGKLNVTVPSRSYPIKDKNGKETDEKGTYNLLVSTRVEHKEPLVHLFRAIADAYKDTLDSMGEP